MVEQDPTTSIFDGRRSRFDRRNRGRPHPKRKRPDFNSSNGQSIRATIIYLETGIANSQPTAMFIPLRRESRCVI